ncbi:ABC-type branched-subunit amino acid transport system substrate-binding protein [Hydrogenophaga palleronii]|uniref:ABC-type branched-subunit amino acid transport system substrate-binding protein n=1 Tax=Hydrogenophaga palleronii TaxID=65655 RepID=A0ABU1WRG1_9BURK|nr:ABC transporter substrate-binding protein [Hydrogenophaga palleronii]MDR7151880.1 ABC-type branched-subunit amino acid transport system substrate-binding protein [Hydrogenophaga palleronii]
MNARLDVHPFRCLAGRLRRTAVAVIVLLASPLCTASWSAELVVVQVAPLTGEMAHYTHELRTGMQLYFERVNAAGGITGDTLRLASLDDAATPKNAIALIEQAAVLHKPIAFMYLVGPETIAAANDADVFRRLGIPLLGSSPAAVQLRSPLRSHVFHLTQGEDAEYAKLVQQLRTIGLRKVALIHWDDVATLGEVRYFEQFAGLAPAIEVVDRIPVVAGSGELSLPIERVAATSAQAIVSMLPVEETAKVLKSLRERGRQTPVYGASYNESGRLFDHAGEAASRGMTVTQIVPNPFGGTLPVVRDYNADLKRHGPQSARAGSLSLEGYLAARLLVEAIRSTPQPVTPAGLRNALEQRSPFDLGGIKATFSATDHVGLDFVDIGVVTYGGRLRY